MIYGVLIDMVKNTFKSPAFMREVIAGEEFDKENTTILRAGKKVNLWQMIQDANVDCEIYPTLEKYGSLKPIETNYELLYGDLGEINGLRDLKDKEIRAKNMWDNLPIEIRNEFGNNRYTFMQEGEQWLKNKLDEIANATMPAPTIEEGEQANG